MSRTFHLLLFVVCNTHAYGNVILILFYYARKSDMGLRLSGTLSVLFLKTLQILFFLFLRAMIVFDRRERFPVVLPNPILRHFAT